MPAPDQLEPYATGVRLALDPPAADVGRWTGALLEAVGAACMARGGTVIGHLKCHGRLPAYRPSPHAAAPVDQGAAAPGVGDALAGAEGRAAPMAGDPPAAAKGQAALGRAPVVAEGSFHCNLTSLRAGATCDGAAARRPAAALDLDLAVLVYGLRWSTIDAVVREALEGAGATIVYE